MKKQYSLLSLPVIVAALGFFVDVFDLLLFGIVRKPSLKDLGLSDADIFSKGELILSVQMIGLVAGGILWGILGDKKGRLKVLFGSILLYAIANIANGFVHTVPQYIVIRFIAGVGLAGELGAGITLTSELLPKEKRGLASTVITVTGVFGSVAAVLLHNYFKDWRLLYFIGGGMGLVLLLLRVSVAESNMFNEVKDTSLQRGNFLMFFNNRDRFVRYIKGILIGIPVWYVIGLLINFSDKFAEHMGVKNIDPGQAIMFQYCGLALGDLSAGLVSNVLKSRKKALYIFYAITTIFIAIYFTQHNVSSAHFYWVCGGLGYGAGISVLYITTSAEQFGTNLRATAAISITNMVRGTLPLILLLFRTLNGTAGNYLTAGWITGAVLMLIAVAAAYFTRESFGKELDFTES